MKPRCLFLILSFSLLACGDDGGGGSDQPDAAVEPSFDREIDLPGMDGPASIYIDGDGVLHAQCASDADCLAVQGYMHASTRFFQMDLRRRLARGKLTEIAGPSCWTPI